MLKYLMTLTVMLTACAPATAQLKVVTPGKALCVEGTTLTPVLGIALENTFGGLDGYEHAKAIREALKDAGFRTTDIYHLDLIDRASIRLSGEINNWVSSSGEQSRKRIGSVDIDVTDLDSKDVVFTIRQQSARSMFQAPTFEQIKAQLVDELSRRYCQAK